MDVGPTDGGAGGAPGTGHPGFTAVKTRLETGDLDATVGFWAGILGLHVADRWAEGADRGVVFALDGRRGAAFVEFGEVPEPRVPGAVIQLRTDDLSAFLRRVGDRWPVDGPHERPWGSLYAYATDPGGVDVVVYQEGR